MLPLVELSLVELSLVEVDDDDDDVLALPVLFDPVVGSLAELEAWLAAVELPSLAVASLAPPCG